MSPLAVFEMNDILRVLPSIVPLRGCCPIWFATVPDTLSPSCVMTALAVYSPASVLNVMSQLPAMSAGGALVLLAEVVLVVDVVAAGVSVPRFALQSPSAIPPKSALPLSAPSSSFPVSVIGNGCPWTSAFQAILTSGPVMVPSSAVSPRGVTTVPVTFSPSCLSFALSSLVP